MRVAIVGFDVDGRSSYEYFSKRGHDITICDQNASVKVPAGVRAHLGADYLEGLDKFDLIIRTAGLNPRKILEKYPDIGDKISSQINEFMVASPTKHIIGITGTKGKGTTSTLTTEILRAAGRRVFLGGNIGIPVLNFIDELTPEDWVVIELSSFQLSDLKRAPHIATCLMIVPDHLNWHEDMADYANAKANLFRLQKSHDIAIYFADDQASHAIARQSPGDKICYYDEPGAYVEDDKIMIDNQVVCRVDELRIPGKHNWQNVCAAVTTAWQAGVMDMAAIHRAVTGFTGLPHRLELVTEAAGVAYYDDSFSTTPETAIAAIEAFHQHKVLILGGSDKGISLQPLIDTIIASPSVRHVVTIGETGPQIARKLREASVPTSPGGLTMMDIVGHAHRAAESGDVVLLSPGCASFGLFKDYKDRGDQFKDAALRI